jgi:hypothetical protein
MTPEGAARLCGGRFYGFTAADLTAEPTGDKQPP